MSTELRRFESRYLVLLQRNKFWRVYDIPSFDYCQHPDAATLVKWLTETHAPIQMFVAKESAEQYIHNIWQMITKRRKYQLVILPQEAKDAGLQ